MNAGSTPPALTIGLCVFNGQNHLAAAIESLLEQSFTDYQLVIYDNASTDGTQAIAQKFAKRDERINIVRHEQNLGPLRNFVGAAELATTEFFCWATHDDLRDSRFLAVLIELLRANSTTGLACCAVRNMDPDGTLREVRTETLSLRTTTGMTAAQRLLMHLRDAAGTPFYGVFRTKTLHRALPVLREVANVEGPVMLGADMAFITAFLKNDGLAVTQESLLLFRRGGWSHRLDLYQTLRGYLRQIRRFDRALAAATSSNEHSWVDRIRLSLARRSYLLRYLNSPPMRRMTWYYLCHAMPLLPPLHAWLGVRTNPAFRRLRRRLQSLPGGTRVMLYGAGKHTRRCLPLLRMAAGSHARIVAAIDDAANSCAPINGLPIIAPSDRAIHDADLVIVSSDAYEAALFEKARAILPADLRVWCVHDPALESSDAACSEASTPAMNLCNSSMASTSTLELTRTGRAA